MFDIAGFRNGLPVDAVKLVKMPGCPDTGFDVVATPVEPPPRVALKLGRSIVMLYAARILMSSSGWN